MRVPCDVDYCEIEEDGRTGPGVIVTCTRCEETKQSFGQGDNSVRRCLVLLREECPEDEQNFYVDDNDG